MSKSLGNYVGISEPPEEMFGKLMSISDTLMWRYLELLSAEDMRAIGQWKRDVSEGLNPRDVKVRLAQELVARFHGAESAGHAHESFVARFQKGQLPDDMPETELAAAGKAMPLPRLLKEAGLAASTSEAIRLIRQGGVRIDGEKAEDPALEVAPGRTCVFQVGKRRFARIRLR
jgi:tyrosyl-tRNA synthetase